MGSAEQQKHMLALAAFAALGIAYGTQMEGWSVGDSCYWLVVTITTVGYGDLSPVETEGLSKFAACAFIIIGVTCVMDYVAGAIHDMAEEMKVALHKEHDDTDDLVIKENAARKQYPVDSASKLLAVLLFGMVFFAKNEGWSYDDAMYWVVCTASTVGYGDLSLEKPSSRLFSIPYILVAIGAFGNVLSEMAEIKVRSRWDYNQQQVKSTKMTRKLLAKMDVDGDGNVTSGEFLAVCLAEMGAVSTKDCRFFLEKFKELDKDNSGTLNHEDLEEMVEDVEDFQDQHQGQAQRMGSFHRKAEHGHTPEAAAGDDLGLEFKQLRDNTSAQRAIDRTGNDQVIQGSTASSFL